MSHFTRFAGGLLLIAFAAFIAGGLVSVRPAVSQFDPGPVVFPLLVAIVLAGLGVVELVVQARSPATGPSNASDPRVLRMLGALLVFLIVFSQLGILVGLAVLVAFTCHEVGGSWRLSATLGLLVPTAEFLLFEVLLGVRLIGL